jgi:hypothetical protein
MTYSIRNKPPEEMVPLFVTSRKAAKYPSLLWIAATLQHRPSRGKDAFLTLLGRSSDDGRNRGST